MKDVLAALDALIRYSAALANAAEHGDRRAALHMLDRIAGILTMELEQNDCGWVVFSMSRPTVAYLLAALRKIAAGEPPDEALHIKKRRGNQLRRTTGEENAITRDVMQWRDRLGRLRESSTGIGAYNAVAEAYGLSPKRIEQIFAERRAWMERFSTADPALARHADDKET